MKKTILILLPLAFSHMAIAQQTLQQFVQADKNAVITVNETTFHTGQVVSKESLSKLFTNSIEVTANANEKPVKVKSFQCVVSIKEANGIWKFNTEESDGNPGRFRDIMAKAKSKDVVFIDDLKYASATPKTFPTQFSFVLE